MTEEFQVKKENEESSTVVFLKNSPNSKSARHFTGRNSGQIRNQKFTERNLKLKKNKSQVFKCDQHDKVNSEYDKQMELIFSNINYRRIILMKKKLKTV